MLKRYLPDEKAFEEDHVTKLPNVLPTGKPD